MTQYAVNLHHVVTLPPPPVLRGASSHSNGSANPISISPLALPRPARCFFAFAIGQPMIYRHANHTDRSGGGGGGTGHARTFRRRCH